MAGIDDEPLTLSSHALDALKEFYAERDANADMFARLREESAAANTAAEAGGVDAEADGADAAKPRVVKPLSMDVFSEDWNESQFWYSDDTANLLASELLDGATDDDVVAVVSAPSVFVALRNKLSAAAAGSPRPRVYLLEHDRRFAVFPEFVFYDYMQPVKLPGHLKGTATRVICDPPFLSEDCQTKAALTVRWLSKPSSPTPTPQPQSRLVVCTGERMESLVLKLYSGGGGGGTTSVRTTTFEPVHARGLGNEFYCYANFECGAWRWK